VKQVLDLVGVVLSISWRNDKARTLGAFVGNLGAAVTLPLSALVLKSLTDAVVAGELDRAATLGALTALLMVLSLMVLHLLTFCFCWDLLDLNQLSLSDRVIAVNAQAPGLAHVEDQEYRDTVETIRTDQGATYYAVTTIAELVAVLVQIVLTAVVLASVAPILLLLIPFALPPLIADHRAQDLIDRVSLANADRRRQARHILRLCTDAAPAKEIRVFGLGGELRARQRRLWDEVSAELRRVERSATAIRSLGQAVFALAYTATIVYVASEAIAGRRTVGDVLLCVALVGQVSYQFARIFDSATQLREQSTTIARYRWLQGKAETTYRDDAPDRPVPDVLRDGISLEQVSFRYPQASRDALREVGLHLPAGSVVAIVGDNGAGKTTLVKLLCRMHAPTAGRILVDGVELPRLPLEDWRARLAAGFQDFCRYELIARETVGVGDLPRIDDDRAVAHALGRAGAEDVINALPAQLQTQLGRTYADGTELSGGQWQKLALGRAMMRDRPLLLILDEPTAALDAHAEHELFERYTTGIRRAAATAGAVTILVSHRFSTVRMADLIVVMEQGRIAETGSHDQLMARDGIYAGLYRLQTAAYLAG
jgi:ATP-binding cassette subfamily B protein